MKIFNKVLIYLAAVFLFSLVWFGWLAPTISNVILAKSISPEILRLKELQNQEKFIDALASGKATMPATYVTGSSQTLIPLK